MLLRIIPNNEPAIPSHSIGVASQQFLFQGGTMHTPRRNTDSTQQSFLGAVAGIPFSTAIAAGLLMLVLTLH